MSKMSRRIVVDASVGRAAGTTDHPTSVHCREFLRTMRDGSHRAVMSPELEREWRKHRSLYAARWLATMRSRKRVVDVETADGVGVLARAGKTVGTLTPRQTTAIEKDSHLVAAAWASDRTVASCDDAMRRLLCILSSAERRLCAIVWVNPDVPGGAATRWLEAGARSEEFRRLAPPG